jgi:hypothetical protein
MIKGLAASLGAIGVSTFVPYNVMGETFNEINHQVNSRVEVLSSYYGAIHKKQPEAWLEAQTSDDVMEGDMLLLFIATSGGVHHILPDGFKPIDGAVKGKGDLTLQAAYKIWHPGDELNYMIYKESRNFFVSLITLRGPKFVVDSKARINTANGCKGEGVTSRINTDENGVLVTAFAYDDPHSVTIAKQETIVSIKNGDDGMAVGVSPTDGGMSRRIRAVGDSCQRGGGDDIAMAISLY